MGAGQVLFFGDETVGPLPALQNLYRHAKVSSVLQRFLTEATAVVKNEISNLPAEQHPLWPAFTTIVELAEVCGKQENPQGSITMMLVCIARLGELLIFAQRDPRILGSEHNPVHMVGLCTGLLPAAAAAISQNPAELFDISLLILSVVIRLAAEIERRSRLIDNAPGSWGYLVTSMSAQRQQEVIDAFHAQEHLPAHRSAYISVIAPDWTTICGPPNTLQKLFNSSPELSNVPHLPLPIQGAVHAPHLAPVDFDWIIGSSEFHDRKPSPNMTIMSPSILAPYHCETLEALLRDMLVDVSQNTLKVAGAITATIELLGKVDVDLTLVGPTTQTALVKRLFDTAGITCTLHEHPAPTTQLPGDRAACQDIAIVGFSGRFPGGRDLEEFWQTIAEAKDHHHEIPPSRFELKDYYDPTGVKKNSITTKYGCFLDNPGEFDARLFNVSPREALQMEPMQRLLLMTTYEALEMAGQPPYGDLPNGSRRVGTFFGQAADDQKEINNNEGTDIYYVPGVARAFAPGRLNHHFKWTGPSYSIDSVCASSCSAILLACANLNARDCDMAVAGGGSILASPNPFSGLSKGGFLSTSGGCKTFRNDADGYCRGEGVGVVILKRLEDALSDNDSIQAVIRGGARNANAGSVSITHPDSDTQEKLYRDILQQASLEASDISYVELHGTATQAGDVAEMTSVANVFGKDRSPAAGPLYVGSIKANTGHSEAAAGVTGLIKCCLMLQNDTIPPQVGMPAELNAGFPSLKEFNVRIPQETIRFESSATKDGKRRVFLNNFDAAGGNVSLLIEDPPKREQKEQDPRKYHIVTLSARTSTSLISAKERLAAYLTQNVVSICDIAYTTNARRGNDIFRAAFVSSSADELLEMIKADVVTDTKRTSEGPGTFFLFTGQGAQYAGMGRVLFKTCKEFRERIEFCDKQATWMGFPSFLDLITDPGVDITSRSAVENQLAIVSLEVALATTWNSWGVVPTVVLGHSLGEYSALCVAGVLSITDMLYLVGHRASLVEENCASGAYQMLSVKLGVDEIRNKLSDKLEISCINTPTATVVSGKTEDIKAFQSELERSGVRADLLKNAFGFHSSQMDPMLPRFNSLAQGVVFSKPLIPVASTLNGSIVRESGVFSASYLADQMRKPVNFVGALKSAQEGKYINDQTLWLELGPGPVCLGLAAAFLDIPATRQMVSLRQREDNSKTIATAMRTAYMAGLSINWAAFYAEHIDTLSILPLPMYAFDVKEYWTPYRTPKTAHLSDNGHQPGAALLEPKLVGFPTTTLQSVEKEDRSPSKISVVFASRLTEPNLMAVMQGHVVSGKAICPSSVFADMACTAARYIYQRIHPGKPQRVMSLEGLDITHPLTISGLDSDQIVRVTATASSSSDWTVQISFSSRDNLKSQTHGSCHVKFADEAEWIEEWDKTAYLVRSRMESMFEAAKTGMAQRLSRRFVYKLFNNVVHYSEPYQGLSEVILGGQEDDAVAIVNFKSLPAGSKFTWAPYWTDPLVHLAGFVLNGNADTPDDIAYLSAGLKSFRVAGELSETKTYFSYVRMRQSRQKGILTGDVYVFEGQKVVAVAAGLMFQKMPKNVLHAILGVGGSNSSVAQHPKAIVPNTHSEPSEKLGVDDLYYDSTPSGANTPWYSSGSDTDESAATSHMGVDAEDIFNQCLSAIAKETGYPIESMNDDAVFEDMGVDSLMSVAIIDTIKKTSGITVPAAFFTVHPTVGAMRTALDDMMELDAPKSSPIVEAVEKKKTPSVKRVSISETPVEVPALPIEKTEAVVASESLSVAVMEPSAPGITPVKAVAEVLKQEITPAQPKKQYSSNVVLLQGRPLSGKTPLFLLVDGAGSSTAYMHLPFFPTNLPVYALESPFLHCPLEYTISIHEIALLFVEAIRKTRPKGPYMMGGWSAGSVYAYEASRILLEAGETISGLILLDMRVPRPMPDGLELTMEIVEQVGLFTGIQRAGRAIASVSDKLRQHLLSTVKQLMAFKALPMQQGKRPLKTVIIWARKGMIDVIKEQGLEIPEWAKDIDEELEGNVMEDESLGLAAWFYGKRTNFGANGWDELLGDVETHVVEGADHFSLVSPPCVKTTGRFMQEAVAAFTLLENSVFGAQSG